MKLNFESHEMQKLNIPMGRAQRADEKSWIICLIIMFILKLWSLKCQIFSADGSKVSVTVCAE